MTKREKFEHEIAVAERYAKIEEHKIEHERMLLRYGVVAVGLFLSSLGWYLFSESVSSNLPIAMWFVGVGIAILLFFRVKQ